MAQNIRYPDLKIGFFGHGNMCRALSTGFIKAGLVKPENVLASNLRQTTPETSLDSGMKIVNSNLAVVKNCDVVFISVKPHIVPSVLEEVQDSLNSEHLFISIAGGITVKRLQEMLPTGSRVVRSLPNTCAMVNHGTTAICRGDRATERDMEVAQTLFGSVGWCDTMDEKFIDPVCGLSGSGTAYAYMAVDAMADGGVKMGLPKATATRLVAQMFVGIGKMVLETGEHPAQLKDNVCSPGGTTIQGVHALEQAGYRGALIDAVEKAVTHCKKLSQV